MDTMTALALAQMYEALDNTRRDATTSRDATAKGALISPNERAAKDREIKRIADERKKTIAALADTDDGKIIRAWHDVKLTDETGLASKLPNRYGGQGHRADLVVEDDAQWERDDLRYGPERALRMQQQTRSITRQHDRAPAGPSTPRHHRRAEDPATQGTTRFVHDRVVATASTSTPPQAPERISNTVPAPRQQQATPETVNHSRSRSNRSSTRPTGPVEVRSQPGPAWRGLPVSTTPVPMPSRIKIFVTNRAVKSGLLPSELLTQLLDSMKHSKKARKTPAYIQSLEGTNTDSAVTTAYMPSVHSTSESFDVVADVDNDQTWLTMGTLKNKCGSIEHRQLQAVVSFLFDINRMDWLEQNEELAQVWNYCGVSIRQEMMIIAQLPESHARTTHFLDKFGFVLQLQEHMLAARAAIVAIETDDDEAKRWFEVNTQYRAFYDVAAGLAKMFSATSRAAAAAVAIAPSSAEQAVPASKPINDTQSGPDRDTQSVADPASKKIAVSSLPEKTSGAEPPINANEQASVQCPVEPVHSLLKSKWAVPTTKTVSTIKATNGLTNGTVGSLFTTSAAKTDAGLAPRTVAVTPIGTVLLMKQNSTALQERAAQYEDKVKKNGIWYSRWAVHKE